MEVEQRRIGDTQEREETGAEYILHAWPPELRPRLFEHRQHAAGDKGSREAGCTIERVKGEGIVSVCGIKVDRIGHTMFWDEIKQCFREVPMRINDHEPTSSLHILVDKVGEEGGL